MKKVSKNEEELLALINKIQTQLIEIDGKMDTLIGRSLAQAPAKPTLKPAVNNPPRAMYQVICADCKKECSIPFKPSGDRPVYCQDCFSRRKMIKLSGMSVADKPNMAPSIEAPKAKKAVTKKKATPKKK